MNPNRLRLPGTATIASLLLLLCPSVAAAQYQFVGQFGSFGAGPGQFNDPRGVAALSSGQIAVSESGNDRVQVCTEQGSCTAFGVFGTLDGQFDRPRGVAATAANEIVIADRGNDRVQICSTSGSCESFGGSGSLPGQFESPRGVAVTAQQQIVVADTENNRIQVCSQSGDCTTFGSFGPGVGQFNSPGDVAVDSQGRIVVSDRVNNRIQVCSTTGSCSAFGSGGSGLGQFDGPTGVAVDGNDRIVVVDRFNHRIQVCSDTGTCSAFGQFGSGPGSFNAPWGVATDAQDRIIVSDLGNNRIQIFAEQQAAAVIESFTASPQTVTAGQMVQFSWVVSNAQACTPSGGSGGWSSRQIDPAGGSLSLTLNQPGSFTFTLQCTGGGGSDTANVLVTVQQAPPDFVINSGLNDAWFNPQTAGQGFFITVFSDIQSIFLAWFTYDTQRPPSSVGATLGEPGHRWLTAFGQYSGNQAVLDVELTSGGVFNAAAPQPTQSPDGAIVLEFSGCNEGTVTYDLQSVGLQGVVPIERIALDNLVLCEP